MQINTTIFEDRKNIIWRHGDLMVSALDDSGSSGPSITSGQGSEVCFWARNLILVVPLFTQVHKWVMANLMLGGGNLAMASNPSRRE